MEDGGLSKDSLPLVIQLHLLLKLHFWIFILVLSSILTRSDSVFLTPLTFSNLACCKALGQRYLLIDLVVGSLNSWRSNLHKDANLACVIKPSAGTT